MFKKILLSTDGSDLAEQACDAAISLARLPEAELRCISVVDVQAYFGTPQASVLYDADFYQELRRNQEDLAEEACNRLVERALAADVKASGMVRTGSVTEEILAEAQDWEADIIVISTHGRAGFAQFVLGSTAGQLVHRADCPVLLHRASLGS